MAQLVTGPAICIGMSQGPAICIGMSGYSSAQREAVTAAGEALALALGTAFQTLEEGQEAESCC